MHTFVEKQYIDKTAAIKSMIQHYLMIGFNIYVSNSPYMLDKNNINVQSGSYY